MTLVTLTRWIGGRCRASAPRPRAERGDRGPLVTLSPDGGAAEFSLPGHQGRGISSRKRLGEVLGCAPGRPPPPVTGADAPRPRDADIGQAALSSSWGPRGAKVREGAVLEAGEEDHRGTPGLWPCAGSSSSRPRSAISAPSASGVSGISSASATSETRSRKSSSGAPRRSSGAGVVELLATATSSARFSPTRVVLRVMTGAVPRDSRSAR